MQQLRNLDLLMYLRAFGLLARNPSIIVVPLLMGVIGVFVSQVGGDTAGGGIFGDLTSGITQLLVLLLKMFAFGTACIIADMAWRRGGRASFDDAWNDARRKGGEIITASLGFTFVLYVAAFAGSLVGPLYPVLIAAAIYFLIYTIAAAAIGGVPGGAAIQVSIERARYNPLPTIIVGIVSVAAFLYLNVLLAPLFSMLVAPLSFASEALLAALFGAVVQAIAVGYIALIVTKTYADLSFGRRF
jgi:hypothetical protein